MGSAHFNRAKRLDAGQAKRNGQMSRCRFQIGECQQSFAYGGRSCPSLFVWNRATELWCIHQVIKGGRICGNAELARLRIVSFFAVKVGTQMSVAMCVIELSTRSCDVQAGGRPERKATLSKPFRPVLLTGPRCCRCMFVVGNRAWNVGGPSCPCTLPSQARDRARSGPRPSLRRAVPAYDPSLTPSLSLRPKCGACRLF